MFQLYSSPGSPVAACFRQCKDDDNQRAFGITCQHHLPRILRCGLKGSQLLLLRQSSINWCHNQIVDLWVFAL